MFYLPGRRPAFGTEGRPIPTARTGARRPRAALLAILVLTSACASAHLQQGIITRDLGRGSAYDLDKAVDAILHSAGYTMQKHWETPTEIYYETDWVMRKPFYDERDRAQLCRTRIIVEAHRERPNVYGVRIRAENAARGE